MAGAQVPETIIGPRCEARMSASTEAKGKHAPVEGV